MRSVGWEMSWTSWCLTSLAPKLFFFQISHHNQKKTNQQVKPTTHTHTHAQFLLFFSLASTTVLKIQKKERETDLSQPCKNKSSDSFTSCSNTLFTISFTWYEIETELSSIRVSSFNRLWQLDEVYMSSISSEKLCKALTLSTAPLRVLGICLSVMIIKSRVIRLWLGPNLFASWILGLCQTSDT